MKDVCLVGLAGRQFNRVSRAQLLRLGVNAGGIDYRTRVGRLAAVRQGVYAIAPVLSHDPWGCWMEATLTAPNSVLSNFSAAAAQGLWEPPRRRETITRPGSGGPRVHDGLLVFRSSTLRGEVTQLRGIPTTCVERTLLDLAARRISDRALARAVREAIRLKQTSIEALAQWLAERRIRRGSRRLARVLSRYVGLPLERARSGAEVRAMEILRAASRPLPRLNVRLAGEEADLSWPRPRLIIEIDGGPFHLDRGEDARKQAIWEGAGWTVVRISADDVYERPHRLLSLAPSSAE